MILQYKVTDYLGIDVENWSWFRRNIGFAEKQDIIQDLQIAEGAMVTALASASRGRYTLRVKDRAELIELIDRVRNFVDHIEETY